MSYRVVELLINEHGGTVSIYRLRNHGTNQSAISQKSLHAMEIKRFLQFSFFFISKQGT